MADGERGDAPQIAAVRAAVLAHVPRDAREARSQRLVVAALNLLPGPFDRHAAQTHITASAIVGGPRGTVLHLHKRTGTWLQPGGHLEPGEVPWEAALRESVEETGLALRHPFPAPALVHLDVHPAFDHVHLDLRYVLEADDLDPQPGPGESPAVRWFSWEEALEITDPSARAALRAARQVLGVPIGQR